MIVLLYSETDAGRLRRNLGASEYSYYFVLKEFRPVLERLGLAVVVHDPRHEADEVLRQARARGEACVLFSFAPPHKTFLGLGCPTVPVFAWEFDSLPNEAWDGDPRNDWRHVLARLGRAVTHSAFAAQVTRRAMGADYPVVSIPAPVWDRFAALPDRADGPCAGRREVSVAGGRVLDTRALDLAPYASSLRRANGYAPLPPGAADRTRVQLDGVVYASVFNPNDGRKNWFDMVGAFCWAFRGTPDATLVLKLTHSDNANALSGLLEELSKLSPFACRVVLVDGFLDDAEYEALADATTYAVNASHGEGQCLPLMEHMSAGKPAVAPAHTAMADYVSAETGFVVRSTPEPSHWPHDPRQAYRTLRHRVDFGSLLAAYQESYRVARGDPLRYARLSANAREALRGHCSHAVTLERLRGFLALPAARELEPT